MRGNAGSWASRRGLSTQARASGEGFLEEEAFNLYLEGPVRPSLVEKGILGRGNRKAKGSEGKATWPVWIWMQVLLLIAGVGCRSQELSLERWAGAQRSESKIIWTKGGFENVTLKPITASRFSHVFLRFRLSAFCKTK